MKEVGRALWGQTDLFLSSLWKSLEGAEGRHPAGARLDEAQCSAMGMRDCQREVHPCLNSIFLPPFEPEMRFQGCHVDIFHYYR